MSLPTRMDAKRCPFLTMSIYYLCTDRAQSEARRACGFWSSASVLFFPLKMCPPCWFLAPLVSMLTICCLHPHPQPPGSSSGGLHPETLRTQVSSSRPAPSLLLFLPRSVTNLGGHCLWKGEGGRGLGRVRRHSPHGGLC